MPRYFGPVLRAYVNGGHIDQPVSVRPEDLVAGTDEDGAPIAGPPVDAMLRAYAMLSQATPPDAVWRYLP